LNATSYNQAVRATRVVAYQIERQFEDLRRTNRNEPAGTDEVSIAPILGLFTDVRLNEICKMHSEGVREPKGVWCFDIKADAL
jgi:hypothetical protein